MKQQVQDISGKEVLGKMAASPPEANSLYYVTGFSFLPHMVFGFVPFKVLKNTQTRKASVNVWTLQQILYTGVVMVLLMGALSFWLYCAIKSNVIAFDIIHHVNQFVFGLLICTIAVSVTIITLFWWKRGRHLLESVVEWNQSGLEAFLDHEKLRKTCRRIVVFMYIHWFLLIVAYCGQSVATVRVGNVWDDVSPALNYVADIPVILAFCVGTFMLFAPIPFFMGHIVTFCSLLETIDSRLKMICPSRPETDLLSTLRREPDFISKKIFPTSESEERIVTRNDLRSKLQFYFTVYNKASTLFDKLHGVAENQLTVTLVFCTIATVIGFYILCNSLLSPDDVNYIDLGSAALLTFLHMLDFWILCEMGQNLLNCNSNLAQTLLKYNRANIDFSTKQYVDSFVLHLTQCPMEAQASHYFNISRSLFSGSMNSILTYMVILVQFKVSFMSTDKSSSEDSNSTEPGNHTGPAIGTI